MSLLFGFPAVFRSGVEASVVNWRRGWLTFDSFPKSPYQRR